MKFSEYMEVRGNNAISTAECKIFGIDNKSGWIKRYADLELSQYQVNKAIEVLSSKKTNSSNKAVCRLQALHKSNYIEWEGKYLYLMKNEIGNLKIGISEDPIKRSRAITSAGGAFTQCVAYWKVSKNSRDVESKLLKKWSKFSTYGEWFKPNSFTYYDVECAMDCEYERLFYNEQWDKD